MFFFGNSRIQFFKISWLNCEQNEKKKLIFPKNFQDSYINEQLYFPAVGTLEETDGLLKDLIRSALSLVIHSICKFFNT